MNKEQLTALGLTEEQADAVINGYGQMVPKSRLDDKIAEVNDYKQQITDRDTQLEGLKKIDAEGLQTKITELQTANEQLKTDHEQQLQQRDFDYTLESALRDAKARNPVTVKALLKLDSLKLDGDKILGLDEQLTAIKTSEDYLFVADGLQGRTPPNPGGGGGKQVDTAKMTYSELTAYLAENPDAQI